MGLCDCQVVVLLQGVGGDVGKEQTVASGQWGFFLGQECPLAWCGGDLGKREGSPSSPKGLGH